MGTAERRPADHDSATSRIRTIVATALKIPVHEVDVDAKFAELMVDSLQKLEIVVQIERTFGARFDSSEAEGIESVDDALALLKAKGVANGG